MNEHASTRLLALAAWLQSAGEATDGGFFTFRVVAGLLAVLIVVAVVVYFAVRYCYRRGLLERFGFGPPDTNPKPPKFRTGNEPASLEEAIKLLTYITKQLDVVDGRTKVLEFDLRKVQTKLDSVETLAHGMSHRLQNIARNTEFNQPPPPPPPITSQTEQPPAGSSGGALPTFRADTLMAARGAYQMLADDRVSAANYETLFADLDSAAQGAVVGEVNYSFRPAESKHSQFVIIPKDGSTGWLFPNPNRVFTEAMKVVFPHLSREQFEDRKISVDPMPVKAGPSGMWERAS